MAGCWISAAVHMTLQPLCLGAEAPSSPRWRTPRKRVPLLATQRALCARILARARARTHPLPLWCTRSHSARVTHTHMRCCEGPRGAGRPLRLARASDTVRVSTRQRQSRQRRAGCLPAWPCTVPRCSAPRVRVLERYAACFGYSFVYVHKLIGMRSSRVHPGGGRTRLFRGKLWGSA